MNKNPLVTFALFSYNQEKYIRKAVEAALAQDYSPLEIIISDDCSWDKTFEIISEITENYFGPHKIILNKNNSNLGIGAHVNLLMKISSGKFIVAAAGDDISFSNRVTRLIDKFQENDCTAYSVWSSAKYIDDRGFYLEEKFISSVKHDDISIIKNKNPVIGATHAWRREVFNFFGPLLPGIVFEDNAISFRSYLLGGIEFVDECLVNYRQHSDNITNFSRNPSTTSLYARAHSRLVAQKIGINQRLLDLDIFEKKSNKKNMLMRKNLEKENYKNNFLEKIYFDFPNFKVKNILYLFSHQEVVKVLIRSILFKIFGHKRVI